MRKVYQNVIEFEIFHCLFLLHFQRPVFIVATSHFATPHRLPRTFRCRSRVCVAFRNFLSHVQVKGFFWQGGVKVLLTGTWTQIGNYQCVFGNIAVPTTRLQAGVLRCYCPGICRCTRAESVLLYPRDCAASLIAIYESSACVVARVRMCVITR